MQEPEIAKRQMSHRDMQPHLPYCASFIVLAALLFLNLDGYQTELGGDFFGQPPLINWTHGWPCYFMVRQSVYPLAVGKGGPVPARFTGSHGTYSRWPFDNAKTTWFSAKALSIDVATFLIVVSATFVGVRTLALHFWASFRFRYGLRHLMGLTAMAAVFLALGRHSLPSRHAWQIIAIVVVLVGFIAAGVAPFVRRKKVSGTVDCSRKT